MHKSILTKRPLPNPHAQVAIKGSKGSGKFGGVQLLADRPDNLHGASPHSASSALHFLFLARTPPWSDQMR